MGKALGIVSLIVLAFGFLVYLSTNNDTTERVEEAEIVAAEETEETEEVVTEPETEPEQTEYVVDMDKAINFDNVLYSVVSYDFAKTVAGYTSQSGQYMIVKINVKNTSDETESVSNGVFDLIINGNEYESDATTTAYYDGGFTFEKITPDMEKTASVVYEVPMDIKGDVMLQVRPSVWGGEAGYINLK